MSRAEPIQMSPNDTGSGAPATILNWLQPRVRLRHSSRPMGKISLTTMILRVSPMRVFFISLTERTYRNGRTDWTSLHSASVETPRIVPRAAAFAMTTKAVGNQLQKLAAQWPADPFRPHLQLKTFFESLSHHPNLTDGAVIATRSLLQNDTRHKVRRCSYSLES